MFGIKQVANDNGITAKVGPAQTQQQPQQQEQAQQPGEPASPEEQAIYKMVVDNAQDMSTTDDREITPEVAANLTGEFVPGILEMFDGVQPPIQRSPIDNLAVTAVSMALFIDESAKEQGVEVSDEILYNAGSEIVEVLAELAEAANVHQYSDQDIEGAWYRALDLYRQVGPRADQDALGEQFAVVANADKEGKLGELLPAIQERLAA